MPLLATADLSQKMADEGFVVMPQALAEPTVRQLLDFARAKFQAGGFAPAEIGRQQDRSRESSIRGDHSLWIDNWHENPELAAAHDLFTEIQEMGRRELFLSLRRFEAHLAMYPPGAGYAPHLDQHRAHPHRQLSVVLYLSDQHEGDGGELVIHNTLTQKSANIVVRPKAGTLVMFLSAKIVHEVRATTKERWSLTGWIRDDLL